MLQCSREVADHGRSQDNYERNPGDCCVGVRKKLAQLEVWPV